jgi:hypothetical protein
MVSWWHQLPRLIGSFLHACSLQWNTDTSNSDHINRLSLALELGLDFHSIVTQTPLLKNKRKDVDEFIILIIFFWNALIVKFDIFELSVFVCMISMNCTCHDAGVIYIHICCVHLTVYFTYVCCTNLLIHFLFICCSGVLMLFMPASYILLCFLVCLFF